MAGAEEPGLLLSPTGLLHYIFPADVRLLAKQIGCDAYNLNQLFGWSGQSAQKVLATIGTHVSIFGARASTRKWRTL